jgi:hypothetical protein
MEGLVRQGGAVAEGHVLQRGFLMAATVFTALTESRVLLAINRLVRPYLLAAWTPSALQ